MFLLVVGYIRGNFSPVPARRRFSGRLRVYPRVFLSCTRAAVLFRPIAGISARFSLLYPRGGVFPAGCGYIRAFFSPVPARRCFSGRLRVYPREFFSCTRAAVLFRLAAGISARFSLLYPRGDTFPAGCGYIRGKSSPVPARRYFYGRLRVYPREIFSCTRAPLAYAFRRHTRALGICLPPARSRLVARAAAAKIRLRRIKHRRVQTAADGLCLRA